MIHGKWIRKDETLYCSECGLYIFLEDIITIPRYCECCGACLDLKENEESYEKADAWRRHGFWRYNIPTGRGKSLPWKNDILAYHCSVCNWVSKKGARFCKMCGSIMDMKPPAWEDTSPRARKIAEVNLEDSETPRADVNSKLALWNDPRGMDYPPLYQWNAWVKGDLYVIETSRKTCAAWKKIKADFASEKTIERLIQRGLRRGLVCWFDGLYEDDTVARFMYGENYDVKALDIPSVIYERETVRIMQIMR